MIVQEAHAPRFASKTDLGIDSGGIIALSLPGASHALDISTNQDDTVTTLDSRSKKLKIKTPALEFEADHGGVHAGTSIDVAVGSGSSLHATASGATLANGTTEAHFSTQDATLRTDTTSILQSGGSTQYRAPRHDISIGNSSAVTMSGDTVTFHVDVDVEGVLNTISGDQTITQVEDPVIQVATDTDTDADLAGEPAGIQIRTVPGDAASVSYMSRFKASDGSALFVDQNGGVDVEKAVASEIFTKGVAWSANGGTRSGGQRTPDSRLSEPAWDIAGGQMRILRYVPDASTNGRVHMYAIIMRVTDAGDFEVSRMKQALDWDTGAGAYAPGPPEYTILQEAMTTA